MKKAIKIILIAVAVVVAVVIALVVGLVVIGNKRNEVYWEHMVTGGDIEKKYTALGSYEAEYVEYSASGVCGKFEIWYPAELKTSGKKYPLVVMANGTGVKASQYQPVFRHLATWGFIVIGNEDENSRTGQSSSDSLNFMLQKNAETGHLFYSKVDTDNIGIGGHSQGGIGAFNAVTEHANGNMYKAMWTASATSKYHSKELNKENPGWTVYPEKVNIPCFMVAGTKLWDAGNLDHYTEALADGETQGICPEWWLDECFDIISDNAMVITARRKDADHGDMLRWGDGYMTAWFCYYLKSDASADFFTGNGAEIVSNNVWQDINKNS